jgi:hypothetical protein
MNRPAPALHSMDSQAARRDRFDAGLWLVLCSLALFLTPVGFVSNDGLGHSRQFAAGTWTLNPNHLLFEPLGAAWQSLWAKIDPARAGVDALKLLAALTGAAAVALFRLRLAPLVAGSRGIANYATAWVALSSAFLRLWVSDEIHMIQMPLVVAAASEALRVLERPTLRQGLRTGIAVGLAALCFLSNLLLGASLALALWGGAAPSGRAGRAGRGREARRAAAGLVAAALLVCVPELLVTAAFTGGAGGTGGSSRGLTWLSHGRLGEASALARSESGYGLERTARGVAEAATRAGYGAASALVDLQPLAGAVRDRLPPSAGAVLGGVACLAALAAMAAALGSCLRAHAPAPQRRVGWLALCWLVPVLAFGFLWSNSDDQFYFQLAPILGLLAAVSANAAGPRELRDRRWLWTALGLAALAFNLADVGARRILYPRTERIAQLTAATTGACLVVLPGFDEAELVFKLSPAAISLDHLSITGLATRWPPERGIRRLLNRLAACHRRGQRVVFVDIFDQPLERNPWKYLRRLGYDHAALLRQLEPFAKPHTSQRAGPFRLRTQP